LLRTWRCNFPVNKLGSDDFDPAECATPPPQENAYLIIGDSFAADAYLIFSEAYPDTYFGQLTVPGCKLRMLKQIVAASRRRCRALYAQAYQLAMSEKFAGVILSSDWQAGHYYRIDELINMLSRPNFRVIVVGQRLRFKERVPNIVARSLTISQANELAMRLIETGPEEVNRVIGERFADRAEFLDLYELQVNNLGRVVSDAGELMYLDDSHLSVAGARDMAWIVRNKFPDLFAPQPDALARTQQSAR